MKSYTEYSIEKVLKLKKEEIILKNENFLGKEVEVGMDSVKVDIELGLTKNLGNFQSLRCHIRLSVPTTMEQLDATYEKSKAWIESKLRTEMSTVTKSVEDPFDI